MIEASDLELPGRLQASNLTVRAGERVAVVGPNGGGKTSLLRALAMIEEASGQVCIRGRSLANARQAERQQLVGLLPASRDLHWPIAVRDLIGLGLGRQNEPRIDELLRLLELEAFGERPSNALSTGERARVVMARVLASQPALLLLDEPLSNLDPYWVLRFLDIIDAQAARGAALLVSLHDLAHLDRFDRALLIADGRIVLDAAPAELLDSPAFESVFRVSRSERGFSLTPPADRRSSP